MPGGRRQACPWLVDDPLNGGAPGDDCLFFGVIASVDLLLRSRSSFIAPGLFPEHLPHPPLRAANPLGRLVVLRNEVVDGNLSVHDAADAVSVRALGRWPGENPLHRV